jgi:WD40 repeat protein
LATWNSSFGAWSPDGSRIVEPLSLNAVLDPLLFQAPLSESALAGTPLANMPIVAVRDATMQAVVTDLEANPPSSGGGTQLAWRPDGKALAVESDSAESGLPPTGHDVTLYDCATGKVLATLKPPAASSSTSQGGWSVRWSPSGKQLMLYDPLLNALVVWGPSMLPK